MRFRPISIEIDPMELKMKVNMLNKKRFGKQWTLALDSDEISFGVKRFFDFQTHSA